MKIKFAKIWVDDQDNALTFYSEGVGFVKKADFPVGPFRWVPLVSPKEPDRTKVLLEPNNNPASK